MSNVPESRIRRVNRADPQSSGKYVLYWMTAARRARHNFALQRACKLAADLDVGLVVLEALRADYRWASDRLHQFVIEGMRDNQRAFAGSDVTYYPYVETSVGAGKGLLAELATDAALVVTDDFPCFFLPKMIAAAGKRLPVRLEAIDSNGLYPIGATERVFTTAASFRRHLQKELPPLLLELPDADPIGNHKFQPASIPNSTLARWPSLPKKLPLSSLPIDHSVPPGAQKGGARAGEKTLVSFLDHRLRDYGDLRNQPEEAGQSCLSPYLHFGHVSAHDVFLRLVKREKWTPERLAPKPNGSRTGWWGMSPAAESFLDELITWREIGLNMCARRNDYDKFESLPEWAQKTLAVHEDDVRQYVYSIEEFEQAKTHDPLWNAAQTQLVRDGVIHNYLRMLWGKKILEWTASPRDALSVMTELNNKYALDGRNPNSYSGIFWVLGRYDRAWGPERPIFGKIRYMSSQNTARKVRVKSYIAEYATPAQQRLLS